MTFTEPEVETLAAAAHEVYRRGPESTRHESGGFESLPPQQQDANRASVRSIPEHLALMGYRLARAESGDGIQAFDGRDTEIGAKAEHVRWSTFTRGLGYRWGPTRDDVAMTHPDLVDWDQLDEPAREKDRERIRAIPELVSLIGLVVEAVGDDVTLPVAGVR